MRTKKLKTLLYYSLIEILVYLRGFLLSNRGGGRRRADALQDRQRGLAAKRPQICKHFYQRIVFGFIMAIIMTVAAVPFSAVTALAPAELLAAFNDNGGSVSLSGTASYGGFVTIFLMKPGYTFVDLSNTAAVEHFGMTTADANGGYSYSFRYNYTGEQRLLGVKSGNTYASAMLNPDVTGGFILNNHFGLSDTFPDISSSLSLEQRFAVVKAELPDEIPVLPAFEVTGANVIYVAPNGNDSNSGSISSPLKTINAALTAYAALGASTKAGGTQILLREGKYAPANLYDGHSASPAAPLFISAYNGENAVISNGVNIPSNAFRMVSSATMSSRLTNKSKVHVREVDLAALGVDLTNYEITPNNVPRLYANGMSAALSRYPNDNTVDFTEFGGNSGGLTFKIDANSPFWSWQNGDTWISASPHADFLRSNYKIASSNSTAKTVTTVQTSSHPPQIRDGNNYYFFNVFEALDSNGEWYIDKANNKLYMYFDDFSQLNEVSLVYDTTPLINLSATSNCVLNGLTFEKTAGNGVNIYAGQRNIIQNCVFRDIGGMGVNIDDSYTDFGYEGLLAGLNGVINSRFSNIASNGVYLRNDWYRYSDMLPSRDFAMNNSLDGTNISIDAIGALVTHNFISNVKGDGIALMGMENILEYNEITGNAENIQDCGGIYAHGTLRSAGNHIRYNYIHDTSKNRTSGLQAGIYLDDTASGYYVYGNILKDVPTPLKSHNGQNIVFADNVLINEVVLNGNRVSDGYFIDNPNYAYLDETVKDQSSYNTVNTSNADWTNVFFNNFMEIYRLNVFNDNHINRLARRYPLTRQYVDNYNALKDKLPLYEWKEGSYIDKLLGTYGRFTYKEKARQEILRLPRDFFISGNLLINQNKNALQKSSKAVNMVISSNTQIGQISGIGSKIAADTPSQISAIPQFAPYNASFAKMGLVRDNLSEQAKTLRAAVVPILPLELSDNGKVKIYFPSVTGGTKYAFSVSGGNAAQTAQTENPIAYFDAQRGVEYKCTVTAYTNAVSLAEGSSISSEFSFKFPEIEIIGLNCQKNSSGEITADVTVKNYTNTAPCSLMLAAYSEDGRLTAIDLESSTINGGQSWNFSGIVLDNSANSAKLRLFLWKTPDTLSPLDKSLDFQLD